MPKGQKQPPTQLETKELAGIAAVAAKMVADRMSIETTPRPTPPDPRFYVAAFDFETDRPGEVALKRDDVVCVLEKHDGDGNDDGWWRGYVVGKPRVEGLVPRDYLVIREGPPPVIDNNNNNDNGAGRGIYLRDNRLRSGEDDASPEKDLPTHENNTLYDDPNDPENSVVFEPGSRSKTSAASTDSSVSGSASGSVSGSADSTNFIPTLDRRANFKKAHTYDQPTNAAVAEARAAGEATGAGAERTEPEIDDPYLVRVLYDFIARERDDLTIKKGDKLTVIDTLPQHPGWWKGFSHSERHSKAAGIFPSNHVEVLKRKSDMKSKNVGPKKSLSLVETEKTEKEKFIHYNFPKNEISDPETQSKSLDPTPPRPSEQIDQVTTNDKELTMKNVIALETEENKATQDGEIKEQIKEMKKQIEEIKKQMDRMEKILLQIVNQIPTREKE